MNDTIKAAYIGAAAVIIGAIIRGIFLLRSMSVNPPSPTPTPPGVSVTSTTTHSTSLATTSTPTQPTSLTTTPTPTSKVSTENINIPCLSCQGNDYALTLQVNTITLDYLNQQTSMQYTLTNTGIARCIVILGELEFQNDTGTLFKAQMNVKI